MVIDDPGAAIDSAPPRPYPSSASPAVMRGLVIALAVSGVLWTTLAIAV